MTPPKIWTAQQVESLVRIIGEGVLTYDEMAPIIGRPTDSLRSKAQQLGLSYAHSNKSLWDGDIKRPRTKLRHSNGFPVMYQDADAKDNQVKAFFTKATL
jgi:hypothetical protein